MGKTTTWRRLVKRLSKDEVAALLTRLCMGTGNDEDAKKLEGHLAALEHEIGVLHSLWERAENQLAGVTGELLRLTEKTEVK